MLAFGDVLYCPQQAPGRTFGTTLDLRGKLHPSARAVLPEDAALKKETRTGFHGALECLLERGQIVRVTDFLAELGRSNRAILVSSAEDLVRALVFPANSVFCGVPMPDTKFGGLRGKPKHLLGPGNCFTGMDLARDVAEIADYAVSAFGKRNAVDLPFKEFANIAIAALPDPLGNAVRFSAVEGMT